MPGKPLQSKLIPHYDFIESCKKKRWSYRQIQQALAKERNISVGLNTLHSFWKVRCQPHRKPFTFTSPSKNNTGDGFFEPAPAPPQQKHERPKYNLDL